MVGIPGEAYKTGFTTIRWPLGISILTVWSTTLFFFLNLQVGWILIAPRLYVLAKRYSWVSPVAAVSWRFQNKYLTGLATTVSLIPLYIYILAQFVSISTSTEVRSVVMFHLHYRD